MSENLENQYRSFEEIEEYFAYISEATGNPHYYQHFESDRVYSDGNYLHLDIFEVDVHAPSVIFVHGTALYSMIYAELLYKLGMEGFNVIGVDLRGHGRSEGTRGDYTIDELIRDVETVVTYVQHDFNDNISIMGSSQGGIISFYMAAKDPRLRGVCCHNFADLSSFQSLELVKFTNLVKLLRPTIRGLGLNSTNPQIPVNSYINLEEIQVRHFGNAQEFIANDPLALKTVSLRAIRSLTNTRLPCPIEEIRTPVMVFQGDQDSIFPLSYTRQIYDRLQCRKRIVVHEGLNHACVNTEVDTILPPVVDWLRSVQLED